MASIQEKRHFTGLKLQNKQSLRRADKVGECLLQAQTMQEHVKETGSNF